jgi:hypothetical protein
MHLVLSGEGASDVGIDRENIGPITKLVDRLIEKRLGYSLLDKDLNLKALTLFSKAELADRAKRMKSRSRKGKKQPSETRYFYNNARALALLAGELEAEDRVVVLFRDGDGTAISTRQEWAQKFQSMLDGFAVEELTTGIPILPKPKSEAWWLCALRDGYQNCQQLEDESGNDASPNSLKSQIEAYLGESATRLLLNDKIDAGEIDIDRIDMDSMNKFKQRLNEVLDCLLPSYEKRSIIDRRPNN